MQCQWLDIFMVKTSLDGRLSSVQIQIHKYTYIYKYKYTGLAHPSCQRFVTFCAVSSSTHVILMSKTGLDGPLRSVHILTTLMKGWIEKLLLGRNIPEMQDVQVILRMRDFPWKIGFSTSSNCHAAIFVAAIWEEKWLSYIFWGWHKDIIQLHTNDWS